MKDEFVDEDIPDYEIEENTDEDGFNYEEYEKYMRNNKNDE